MPDDCLADLARLGVLVVTQPNFVAERGDQYLADVPADEHHQLWRVASLLAADVKVVLSTDMPFGDADPWAAMRAAVHRTTAAGAVLGPAERIDARTALQMFLGEADRPTQTRTVAPGAPANLCVTRRFARRTAARAGRGHGRRHDHRGKCRLRAILMACRSI